ncbi:hypothetical protein FHS31_002193 [Sphingomonas vulcanisoli]|uniref:Uncharacterized protein n=1 Tax=Sphingomonas vulcanisoli TaxID=1658060 RepID=A0ABX0TST0_9SPHN|nr:hypothetical protein [Sphingomonas vulcanisoli]
MRRSADRVVAASALSMIGNLRIEFGDAAPAARPTRNPFCSHGAPLPLNDRADRRLSPHGESASRSRAFPVGTEPGAMRNLPV